MMIHVIFFLTFTYACHPLCHFPNFLNENGFVTDLNLELRGCFVG